MPVARLVAVATGPVLDTPAVQVAIDRLEVPVVGTGCHQGARFLAAVDATVEHRSVQHVSVEGERCPVQTGCLLDQLPELVLWELVFRDPDRGEEDGKEEAAGGSGTAGVGDRLLPPFILLLSNRTFGPWA